MNYSTVVPWDVTLIDVWFTDIDNPLVKGLVKSAVKITTGAPVAVVGKHMPGGLIYNAFDATVYEMTGTTASPSWTLITSGATGDQSAIQFKDEGVNLGTAGTVNVENFIGSGVTVTRVGNVITINVPGGANGGSAYSTGDANNFAMIAGTATTFTNTGAAIISTGNTGETTLTGAALSYGTGSDTGTTAPYATGVTSIATLWAQLKALTGTAITTPATLETNNLSGLGAGVFAPGVYTTASAIGMTASRSITLSGDGDYVFVSTGGAITFGATDTIILTNGASAARVYWVANNAITTGSTNTLYGNFLTGTTGDITIGSTNIIQGRLLSQKAIIIDGTASAFALPLGGSTSGVALANKNMFVGSLSGIAVPTPVSHVVKYASKVTWSGSGASLAVSVPGVLSTDIVLASVQVASTQTGYIASVAPTTDTITIVLSTANTSNQAVIAYEVLRAI